VRDTTTTSEGSNGNMAARGELSRSEVRAVRCPACEAKPGTRCVGVRGRAREANHRERVELAQSTWIDRVAAEVFRSRAVVEGSAVEVA
jgi:hypothetical protein